MKTTMNAVKGYEINHEEETMTITKKFNKAAGVYGSEEYKILMGMKKEGYEIIIREIEKKEGKVSYAGLTVYKMQAAVQIIAGEQSAEVFQNQVKVYDGEKGKYATVKKIFLNSYKKEYQKLTVDEMVEVDRLAKEIKAKALKEKEEAEKAKEAAKKVAREEKANKTVEEAEPTEAKEDGKIVGMPKAAPEVKEA